MVAEDAAVVSRSFSTSKSYAIKGTVKVPRPRGVSINVGDWTGSFDWWKIAVDGVVVRTVTERDIEYVVIAFERDGVMIGDKLATYHGLKFVVGEIREDIDMPIVLINNRPRPCDVLITAKNINRGMAGQGGGDPEDGIEVDTDYEIRPIVENMPDFDVYMSI
eukprot:gene24313-9919_t